MKNILLAVVGLSPQVLTETLFALHQQNRQMDAIHLITTRQGKEAVNATLLSPVDGRYVRYLNEYDIQSQSIDFGYENIHTIKNGNGLEIDDITTEEDNEMLLKKCLELTFLLTKDPGAAIFFSVAGGRKTMSACLTLAAQMYGRPQDRIYHVLVSPEFESNRDFFYPPRKTETIRLRDREGQPYFKDTRYANINLVPIPFVSIRDRLSDDMLKEPKDPVTLMLSLIREDAYQLIIDLNERKLVYKKRELDLMDARLALYAFFALRKKNCRKEVANCRGCTDCFLDVNGVLEHQEEIAGLYRRIAFSRDFEAMSGTGILALTLENFNSYKGKIRKDLESGFGPYSLPEVAIESEGRRPDTRYGLRIDRDKIRIIL